ncbi:MAG: transketolase C-terminal domain-containing protein, partial [Acidimicrobiales bacterium]
QRLLKWAPGPGGRHIELGISEMNLFLLLGQLGLSHDQHGEVLLPVGTLYDPFVLRGLDAFVYSLYNGARFVVAGTPSGVTLAPEGGAHQSTITGSVGLALPGVTYCEPAYDREVDWLLCDGLDRLTRTGGDSTYLRLSTRSIDQEVFWRRVREVGEDQLRRDVISGGYRLVDAPPDGRPGVTIVASGAVVPEALAAAAELDEEGVAATVINVTSADRLYRGWQGRFAEAVKGGALTVGPAEDRCQLHRLVAPEERDRPVVSVHDAASHTLAWMGAALGARQTPLGVDRFGESGTIAELHELCGISAGHVVNAALIAVSRPGV